MTWLLLNMWLVNGNYIVISTYEIYSMRVACSVLVHGNDMLLIHMKYQYALHLLRISARMLRVSEWK